MGLVTEVLDEAAPTVLLVDNNPMSSQRLSNLFKIRNFHVVICEDGDQAVDEYIRLDPELVILSLDIPSLDGHLAALEMREHGGESRIVFLAPARMSELAHHAAYSAGAVAWLQKPVSAESLEAVWKKILGPIPAAPGLEDLDQLYPDRVQIESDTGPLVPKLPLQPLPILPLQPFPRMDLPAQPNMKKEQSKPKKRKPLVLLLILLLGGAVGYLYAQGMLSL